MSILMILVILALAAIVAALWYAVRTHKTVAQLKAKFLGAVDHSKDP